MRRKEQNDRDVPPKSILCLKTTSLPSRSRMRSRPRSVELVNDRIDCPRDAGAIPCNRDAFELRSKMLHDYRDYSPGHFQMARPTIERY